jgi:FkbM family methyltransferase
VFGRTTDRLIARYGWRRAIRLLLGLRKAKYLPKGNIVGVNVPGLRSAVHIRSRTSDALVLKQALLENDFWFGLPGEPRFIIDAGANIGVVSAVLATRFPGARIVALELDFENFTLLKKNVAPYVNVTALHAGLWSNRASLTVSNPEATSWAFRAEPSSIAGAKNVQGLGVADLLRQFEAANVDLLKIDIEGGEIEVFGEGADEWIDRVSVIAVELHDKFVPGCEETVVRRIGGNFTRSRSGDYDVFVRRGT